MDTQQPSDHTDRPDSAGSICASLLNNLEDNAKSVYDRAAITTGFNELDNLLQGLEPGSLTVIASRPGIGRTTLLTDICRWNAVRQGVPTLAYTLEEKRSAFMQRVLGAESRVALFRMRSGGMNDEDWTRVARRVPDVSGAPLYVRAPGRINMLTLSLEAQEMVEEEGVRLVAVDGVQDIRPDKRSDMREREVGDIARDLKTMVRELDVPVVVTSHLNRGPEQREDKKPMLDDLRESGAITYAADNIILLHREDAYDKASPRGGEADLFVAKYRHGPAALITVAYQAHYGRFVDMAQT